MQDIPLSSQDILLHLVLRKLHVQLLSPMQKHALLLHQLQDAKSALAQPFTCAIQPTVLPITTPSHHNVILLHKV